MQIDSIEDLVIKMHALFPVSWSKTQLPLVVDRYTAGLKSLTLLEVEAAWNRLASTWTKRAAPAPADILAAHQVAGARYSVADGAGDQPRSFTERLWDRDQKRLKDRREIIAGHRNSHGPMYDLARRGGYLWRIELCVERAANIISQRNESRRLGHQVDEISRGAAAYYQVVTMLGVDHIDILPEMLAAWADDARKPPAPGYHAPKADRALEQAGMRPMEITYQEERDPLAAP